MFVFFIPLLVFVATLVSLDRYFLKLCDGFCVRNIYSTLPPVSSPDLSPCPSFHQPFYYLAKGHQSYVFLSQDNKYVIKFYRFPSHLRPFPWLNHPLSHLGSRFGLKRKEIQKYNHQKLASSFASYALAYKELEKESALLYIHLHPTSHLKQTITLIDPLGACYLVPLDKMHFVVQQKVDLIFPTLERFLASGQHKQARELISSIVHLLATQWRKNITNNDPILEKNYGCIGTRAICLDVGRFVKKPSSLPLHEEVHHLAHSLASWLKEKDPELFHFYLEEIHGLSTSFPL